MPGLVRSAIGDPDLRSPSGFDSGLRPPLRMTRKGKFGKESQNLRWIFRRYFFSLKLIKSLLLWEKGDHGSGG